MSGQWLNGFVDGDPGFIHVLPMDDLEVHSVEGCNCGSITEVNYHGIPLVIHKSFDGREIIERAIREMSVN